MSGKCKACQTMQYDPPAYALGHNSSRAVYSIFCEEREIGYNLSQGLVGSRGPEKINAVQKRHCGQVSATVT